MREEEEKTLQDILDSVRPYLAFPSELEGKVKEASEKASSLDEFEESFRDLRKEEDDPSRRADCRIFLNKLQSR